MTAHTERQRQQIKAAVRARDGHCTECGLSNQEHVSLCGKQLHVHRVQPGSPYSVEGCVSLCKNCHAKAPKRKCGEDDQDSRGGMVCVKETLAQQADFLCEQNATNLTQEVNRALRELLMREGLWPPPKKEKE
jgi:hypothetical protein